MMSTTPFEKKSIYSFGRFWGYRSIFKIIPSWMMTLVLGLFFIVIVRPMSMLLVYGELLMTTVYYCLYTLLHVCSCSVNRRQETWGKCTLAFGELINPCLFFRGIAPGASRCFSLNKAALFRSSMLFRIAVHYL